MAKTKKKTERSKKFKTLVIDGQPQEVDINDELITVGIFKTYDNQTFMVERVVEKSDEFDKLCEAFRTNLQVEFDKLPLFKRQQIIHKRADLGGGIYSLTVKSMLRSEYEKCVATERGLRLFGQDGK